MTTARILIGAVAILSLAVIVMARGLWKQRANRNKYYQALKQQRLLALELPRLCYLLILIFGKEAAERPLSEFPQWSRSYLKDHGGIDAILASINYGTPPGMDGFTLSERKEIRDALKKAVPQDA